MSGILLEGRSLVKHFPTGGNRVVHAVDEVSLELNRGEFLGLVGESGCGKSSLGRMLLRLIEPSAGKVFFAGKDLTACSQEELRRLRRSMQMIFQDPLGSFNPKIRIGNALMEAARFHGMNKQEGTARIAELLSYVSLPKETLFRLPRELSGGQLQRLSIARALISSPAFIVADEPVSALDISVQAQLLNLLCELRERFEMAMLFISHDIMVVKYLCDRVAVMYLGVIVETAPAAELFHNPLHHYTRALIASAPKLEMDKIKSRELLEGDPAGAFDSLPGCRFAPRCKHCQDRCRREKPPLVKTAEDHWAACFDVPVDAAGYADKTG